MRKKFLIALWMMISGSVSAQTVSLDWIKQTGGASYDYCNGVAADASGNLYATGGFKETVDFDPGTGVSNLVGVGTSQGIYLQKLDNDGNFIWVIGIDDIGNQGGTAVAVDASGNVYVHGYFQNTVDFDPGSGTANLTSTGGYDCFILKLNSSGDFMWVKQIGGTPDEFAYSMATDASGHVYTMYRFSGVVDFNPGAGTSNLTSVSGQDMAILKLDTDGNYIWAKSVAAAGFHLDVDANSNVYAAGWLVGTVDFNPGTSVNNLSATNSQSDVFVLKLDVDGNYVWAKGFGGTQQDGPRSICVDDNGNAYISGFFSGTADFDPSAGTYNLTSVVGGDQFVLKLDASGNFVWANTTASTTFSLALNASSEVYVLGTIVNTIDMDPGPGTVNFNSWLNGSSYLQKFDAAGNFLWAQQFAGGNGNSSNYLCTSQTGDVFASVMLVTAQDFDSGPGVNTLTPVGGYDYVILKFVECAYISIDATTSISGNTISANATSVIYNWLDCNNSYSLIPGESSQQYTPGNSGSYAVEVIRHGCRDTSSCNNIVVTNVLNTTSTEISAYPNPSHGSFTVNFGDFHAEAIVIYDATGKLVQRTTTNESLLHIELEPGLYILCAQAGERIENLKLVVE